MNRDKPSKQALRIAVLISGGGTTLQNFVERINDGRLCGVEIVQVISSRGDVRGVDIAREVGLPLSILRKRDSVDIDAYSDALARGLDAVGADLAVMGGFLSLWRIPPRYEGRVLNIHPALLPNFGGRGMFGHHVHEAVLAAGERESGCTVHLADNLYDHGPIIAQARVPVFPEDDAAALAQRVGTAERELYPRVLQGVAEEGLSWLTRHRESPLLMNDVS